MYTVLIADDEPRICELIKHLIRWTDLGLTFLGSVHDGQELLEQILQQRPDIVITDVVMPRMTGLEIIQRIREEKISCNFVIISGHRYFEFVQDAIKYGAQNYLLKPIDGEELNATLKKICDHMTDQLEEKMIVSSQHRESLQTRQILRRHLLSNSFLARTERFDDMERLNREYSAVFHPGAYQAMILSFEPENETDDAVLELVAGKAVHAIESRLQSEGIYVLSCVLGHWAYFLINYESMPEDKGLMEQIFSDARQEADVFPGVCVTLGYGTTEQYFDCFPQAIRMANLAIRERIRLGRGRAIGPEELSAGDRCCELSEVLSVAQVQQLSHIFDGLNQEKYVTWVNEVCGQIMDNCAGAVWYELCDKIGEVFDRVVHSHKESAPQTPAPVAMELVRELERTTRDRLPEALKAPVLARMRALLEEKQGQSNRPVRLAKEYIEEHYMEPIRLEDVAGKVYLHPAYLSHIFKETEGIGFSDYVANCRLERAKYLLTHTNDTIYGIARQVGYTEPRAFSKFFLKNVGVKPSDYRKMYS